MSKVYMGDWYLADDEIGATPPTLEHHETYPFTEYEFEKDNLYDSIKEYVHLSTKSIGINASKKLISEIIKTVETSNYTLIKSMCANNVDLYGDCTLVLSVSFENVDKFIIFEKILLGNGFTRQTEPYKYYREDNGDY